MQLYSWAADRKYYRAISMTSRMINVLPTKTTPISRKHLKSCVHVFLPEQDMRSRHRHHHHHRHLRARLAAACDVAADCCVDRRWCWDRSSRWGWRAARAASAVDSASAASWRRWCSTDCSCRGISDQPSTWWGSCTAWQVPPWRCLWKINTNLFLYYMMLPSCTCSCECWFV